MKYRNMIRNDDGTYNIVWFGSYGTQLPKSFELVFDTHYYSVGFQEDFYRTHSIKIDIPQQEHAVIVIPNRVIYIGREPSMIPGGGQIQLIVTIMGELDLKNNANKLNIKINPFSNTYDMVRLYIKCQENNYTMDLLANTTVSSVLEFNTLVPSLALKADNYVEGQEGIAKSLTQRLAVIKGELWYDINYGLPLLDKIKNKAIFDAYIIKTINAHQEVKNIKEYVSEVNNGIYTYTATIISIYGDEFELSSQSNI